MKNHKIAMTVLLAASISGCGGSGESQSNTLNSSSTIQGYAVDDFVLGAKVKVYDAATNALLSETVTKDLGSFIFPSKVAGKYRIEISGGIQDADGSSATADDQRDFPGVLVYLGDFASPPTAAIVNAVSTGMALASGDNYETYQANTRNLPIEVRTLIDGNTDQGDIASKLQKIVYFQNSVGYDAIISELRDDGVFNGTQQLNDSAVNAAAYLTRPDTTLGSIADQQLRTCVALAIGKEDPQSISSKDFELLAQLDCVDSDVASLEGVQSLKGLRSINIRDNKLTSIEPLRGLTKLEVINIRNGNISTLSPLRDRDSPNELFLYVGGNCLTAPNELSDSNGFVFSLDRSFRKQRINCSKPDVALTVFRTLVIDLPSNERMIHYRTSYSPDARCVVDWGDGSIDQVACDGVLHSLRHKFVKPTSGVLFKVNGTIEGALNVNVGLTADEHNALIEKMNTLWATTSPTQAEVRSLLTDTFLNDGENAEAFAKRISEDASRVGLKLSIKRTVAFDSSKPNNIDETKTQQGDITEANTGLVISSNEGNDDGIALNVVNVNGQWKLAGNQRVYSVGVRAKVGRYTSEDTKGVAGWSEIYSGLWFGVDTRKMQSTVSRIVISSSVLPDEVVYELNPESGLLEVVMNPNSGINEAHMVRYARLVNPTSITRQTQFTIDVYKGTQPLGHYINTLQSDSVPAPETLRANDFTPLTSKPTLGQCSDNAVNVSWSLKAGQVSHDAYAECFWASVQQLNEGVQQLTGQSTQASIRLAGTVRPGADGVYVNIETLALNTGIRWVTEYALNAAQDASPVKGSSIVDLDGRLALRVGRQTPVAAGQSLYLNRGDTWYSQVCSANGGLIAVNFDSNAIVSGQTSFSQLSADRTFAPVACAVEDRAANSLKFNTDGTATLRQGGDTKSFSSTEVQTLLTASTPEDASGVSSALRWFKAVVNGVEHHFLVEKDVSLGAIVLTFWKEVFPLLD